MATAYNMAFACFDCRKSFKRHYDLKLRPEQLVCPNCGGTAFNFGLQFKPPKIEDDKQWAKVRFLFDHGFRFQKIRLGDTHHDTVAYPETLDDARQCVIDYAEHARHDW